LLVQLAELEIDDAANVVPRERTEDDRLVDAVEELSQPPFTLS
jgi:hypothetical protein